MPGIREKKGDFDKRSLATSSSFTASIIGGDNGGNKMQSKLKGIMERLKQKREERGGALSEESNDDDDDLLDKDEEEIMRAKLQEIQLKAANKLRRRSTIVMGAKSMSPKAVKK
jgi:hypothetical protein